MKQLILLALLASVALADEGGNFHFGHKRAGDVLVEEKVIEESNWVWSHAPIEKVVTFGKDGKHRITRIEAHNLNDYASNTVQIVAGGLNHTFVSLKFASQKGLKVHYLVKVYGKPIYGY